MAAGKVNILRGIPGCGKSTYARSIPHAVVCSADDFFMEHGVYKFNPSLLGQAHAACFNKFLQCLAAGCPYIIVDNTNTQLWEFQNYIDVARMVNYDVIIRRWVVDNESDIHKCLARNTHGVPESVIRSMIDRFEPYHDIKKIEYVVYLNENH